MSFFSFLFCLFFFDNLIFEQLALALACVLAFWHSLQAEQIAFGSLRKK